MKYVLLTLPILALIGCAGKEVDAARPTAEAQPKSLSERLSQSGGYKQDADGSWVPKSDKRSSYDSQRDSPYFKGKVDKKAYKTGDFAKKSWWGSKEYERKGYAGNTDGSRFQKSARQQGQSAAMSGQKAKLAGPFETNTISKQNARETRAGGIDRPINSATEAKRKTYKAPSVIDWKAQRSMSVDQSRGILGR